MMSTSKNNLFFSSNPLLEGERKEIFDVTFWGVRGVHPCSGEAYHRFGGHTICTSAFLKSEEAGVPPTHLIFDAGSGLAPLGQHLIKHFQPHRVFLFFSHVHLDHFMGMPFFLPFWKQDWEIDIFCGHLETFGGIKDYFQHLISPPLFPVPFKDFPASLKFHTLEPDTSLPRKGFHVQTFPLNHPGDAIGFRVSFRDKHVCYVTDTEHVPGAPDVHVLKGIQDADLVIYDSTYTDEIWPSKIGWGHSTWQEGIRLAKHAGVKNLALYHHEPLHTDEMLEAIEKEAQATWERVFSVRQNMTISFL
ncbi:MAG: MBL fold metallo-hydrolase [Alphaproteobacteria bacterium]